jgi:hypothetical protein
LWRRTAALLRNSSEIFLSPFFKTAYGHPLYHVPKEI